MNIFKSNFYISGYFPLQTITVSSECFILQTQDKFQGSLFWQQFQAQRQTKLLRSNLKLYFASNSLSVIPKYECNF